MKFLCGYRNVGNCDKLVKTRNIINGGWENFECSSHNITSYNI